MSSAFFAIPDARIRRLRAGKPLVLDAFGKNGRGSPVRTGHRWRKRDSNLRSRRNRNACSEAYRVCFKVRARLGMTGAGNGHSPRPRAARTALASTIHHSG
jgi:hypothetical protein